MRVSGFKMQVHEHQPTGVFLPGACCFDLLREDDRTSVCFADLPAPLSCASLSWSGTFCRVYSQRAEIEQSWYLKLCDYGKLLHCATTCGDGCFLKMPRSRW